MIFEVPAEVTMNNKPNVALDVTLCSSKYRRYGVHLISRKLPNDGGGKFLRNAGIIYHTIHGVTYQKTVIIAEEFDASS